jgi:hypothetical protein
MTEGMRLAEQLGLALEGGAWHGPSWREVLDGIGFEGAMHRPVPGAHSIAEIVLHATTWHDAARRRFEGENPEVSDEQDWPRAAFGSESEWRAAVEQLFETGRALREAMARFPDARLDEKRSADGGTWYLLLVGILQHDLYHAGQVGLLRKAAVAAAARR